MNECIFCKIAKKEIPANFVYEDDDAVVFRDIHPMREFHVLVVPKIHIVDVGAADQTVIFGTLFNVAQKIIKQEKLDGKGYRILVNGGGAQAVDHLHLHLMAPVTKAAKM